MNNEGESMEKNLQKGNTKLSHQNNLKGS